MLSALVAAFTLFDRWWSITLYPNSHLFVLQILAIDIFTFIFEYFSNTELIQMELRQNTSFFILCNVFIYFLHVLHMSLYVCVHVCVSVFSAASSAWVSKLIQTILFFTLSFILQLSTAVTHSEKLSALNLRFSVFTSFFVVFSLDLWSSLSSYSIYLTVFLSSLFLFCLHLCWTVTCFTRPWLCIKSKGLLLHNDNQQTLRSKMEKLYRLITIAE